MAQTLIERADAMMAADPELAEMIAFAPVPRRARGDGWSAARQRDFVRVLLATGVPGLAAKSVGMSRQSAYRLRDAPGAAEFRAAWDAAADVGQAMALDRAMAALDPVTVPRFYRGQQIGTRTLRNDTLVLAALRSLDLAAVRSGSDPAETLWKVTR